MQNCGEIAAYKGKNWMGLLNMFGMSLYVFSEIPGVTGPPGMAVAAQDFEHEISNILDKPTESLLGYTSISWSSLRFQLPIYKPGRRG